MPEPLRTWVQDSRLNHEEHEGNVNNFRGALFRRESPGVGSIRRRKRVGKAAVIGLLALLRVLRVLRGSVFRSPLFARLPSPTTIRTHSAGNRHRPRYTHLSRMP